MKFGDSCERVWLGVCPQCEHRNTRQCSDPQLALGPWQSLPGGSFRLFGYLHGSRELPGAEQLSAVPLLVQVH